jgi:hypothetical protein
MSRLACSRPSLASRNVLALAVLATAAWVPSARAQQQVAAAFAPTDDAAAHALDELAFGPAPLYAQAAPSQQGTSSTQGASSATASEAQTLGEQPPSSTETGQSPLSESFGPQTHAEWVRETRRKAWQDTKIDLQARTYYLDRDKYDDSESTAWALGGSLGFKTGYFRERFSLGATAYTSVKLYGPEDKDGTTLLKPGQHDYAVLGELYGEVLLNEDTRLTIGARAFDTPYINRNDSRMTPNTFKAAVVQGLYGGDGRPEWRVGGGYFYEIKERNSDDFTSMATDAGAPPGVHRGVWAGGANVKFGDWSLGAIDYYSNDIINIFYTEGKYTLPIGEDLKLAFALQYSDQQSTGSNLLRGTDFNAHQWGGKAELGWHDALFTVAYTSASGDTNMQNPWSGYPGYTSVQVEDFNRDGEDAWMLRAAYNFPQVKGLSIYGLYVDGTTPDSPGQFSRKEADFNIQWTVPEGTLEGLMVRLRYAQVNEDNPLSSDLKDLRLMVYYDPPSL